MALNNKYIIFILYIIKLFQNYADISGRKWKITCEFIMII